MYEYERIVVFNYYCYNNNSYRVVNSFRDSNMNREQAKTLKFGQTLIQTFEGKQYRWRVNGKVKTWKRDSNRIQVPLKHGLYKFGYLTKDNLNIFTIEGN